MAQAKTVVHVVDVDVADDMMLTDLNIATDYEVFLGYPKFQLK